MRCGHDYGRRVSDIPPGHSPSGHFPLTQNKPNSDPNPNANTCNGALFSHYIISK